MDKFGHKGKKDLGFSNLNTAPQGHMGKYDSAKPGSGGSKDKLSSLDAAPGNPKTLNQDYPTKDTGFDSTSALDRGHGDRSLTKDYGK